MARPIEALEWTCTPGWGSRAVGVDAVVLNGIGRAHQLGMLQPRDGVQAVPSCTSSGKLEERPWRYSSSVCRPQGSTKIWCLGLSGKRTILVSMLGQYRGPTPLDGAIEQGAPVQVIPDDGMGMFIGIGEVAYGLILDCPCGRKRKGFWDVVSRLQLHLGDIHTPPVHPGRRPRFESPHGKPQGFETVR